MRAVYLRILVVEIHLYTTNTHFLIHYIPNFWLMPVGQSIFKVDMQVKNIKIIKNSMPKTLQLIYKGIQHIPIFANQFSENISILK
jgi:hypothetical protein